MKFASLLALACLAGCQLDSPDSESDRTAALALAPGGSNYLTYRIDNGCDREAYGVINRYHVATSTIRNQLQSMFAAGQRRLRLGIFHWRNGDTGTVMSSATGDLSPQNRANLAGVLAAVKSIGYAEVEIAFHALGDNNPGSWSAWREDYYQENWNLIWNLHPLIAAAGIPYRIDLLNEGMPMTSEPQVRADYARRLWNDYTWNFGKADTVGFSLTVWLADRVRRFGEVYGNNPPDVFELHFYGDSHNGTEREQFVAAHDEMTRLGYHQPWIAGETYFNDATAASGIRQAIDQTGRDVLYLTQWPLTRDRPCADVSVAPPSAYNQFSSRGF